MDRERGGWGERWREINFFNDRSSILFVDSDWHSNEVKQDGDDD